jgi:triphosphoribosyl-dephospho-CoA synthase
MTEDAKITLHAQLACVWEACAEKPGNVTRSHDFSDTSLIDFLASAAAAAPALARAAEAGVGAAILDAVQRTRLVTGRNTNLGIVLLLAPLCAARLRSLSEVLASLTLDDSRCVARAIRLCSPGGLGRVPEEDVADEPTLPLGEWMALAAHRDRVAAQYVHGFAGVHEAAEEVAAGLGAGLGQAIARAHVTLLARHGDSLIARKRGEAESREAARLAGEALAGRISWHGLDGWLRAEGSSRNPGTTADLIAAGLFTLLGDGRLTPDARW